MEVLNLLYAPSSGGVLKGLDTPGKYLVSVKTEKAETSIFPIILDVVYVVNQNGLQLICAKDDNGAYVDYIYNENIQSFEPFTPYGEIANWDKEVGKTPGILQNYRIGKFNVYAYESLNTFASSHSALSISRMVNEIGEKEPDAAKALEMVIRHIHGTYSDKYAKGQDVIDTKKMLYDKTHGDFLNVYQVSRYLQRYVTTGSAKSHLIKDIEKAIHYLVFEMTRRIRIGDINEVEPKH